MSVRFCWPHCAVLAQVVNEVIDRILQGARVGETEDELQARRARAVETLHAIIRYHTGLPDYAALRDNSGGRSSTSTNPALGPTAFLATTQKLIETLKVGQPCCTTRGVVLGLLVVLPPGQKASAVWAQAAFC